MPVILSNVFIWTQRPAFSGGITRTPQANLTAIPAHAGPVPSSDWQALPQSALESQYLLKVEVGTDAKFGDTLSRVTLNDPPVYTPWDALGANEVLYVLFARDSSAGPLAHRRLYCKRITGGGPSV